MSSRSGPVWRVLNVEASGYSASARERLASLASVDEADLSRAELLQRVGAYDAIIVRLRNRIDAEVMDRAPSLRVIVTATTGLDHIDVEAAAARGVTVLSLRGEVDFLSTITATAEHTWALLLALVRGIPAASAAVARGDWNRDDFIGDELAGKSLAILGLGRIGRQVAGYGLAFRMTVRAFDPYQPSFPDGVSRAASMNDLLSTASVLSVHLPLTDVTREAIGETELATLPAGAMLINTSRGEIVDETAVVRALQRGHLAGVAVDVLRGELDNGWRASPLVQFAERDRRAIITPHIAGACRGAMRRTEEFMADKLVAFLQAQAS